MSQPRLAEFGTIDQTADAGYFTETSVSDSKLEGIDLLVAPDRQKHGEVVPVATGPPDFLIVAIDRLW